MAWSDLCGHWHSKAMPVMGCSAAVSLLTVALLFASNIAIKHVTVSATGSDEHTRASGPWTVGQRLAATRSDMRARQQQQAGQHRAAAFAKKRSAASSSINVMGSPFISTPVGLPPSPADVAAATQAQAAIASASASRSTTPQQCDSAAGCTGHAADATSASPHCYQRCEPPLVPLESVHCYAS